MLYKQNLNHRQTAWLTATLLCSGSSSMLTFYQNIVREAGVDAWFSQLMPIGYALFVAAVLTELARVFPGKTLFEIIMLVCGRWVGRVFNLILLFYLWIVIAVDVNGIGHFLKASLLPRTPVGIIIIVFILMLLTYRRLEVAASVNELTFPFYSLTILLMTILLGNEYLFGRVEPVFSTSLAAIFGANYMSVGLYGDLIILGAFLPAFSHPRLSFVSMKHGIILAAFMITLVCLVTLGVLGTYITSELNYPSWTLVQEIRLTDFLDRLELYMLSVWFPVYSVKVILTYLALQIGLSSLSGVRQYSVYNPALGTFLIPFILLAFREARGMQDFVSYSYTAVALAIQVPLLLILFLYAKTRRTRREENWRRIPKRRAAAWTCNGSLLGGAATILAGKMMFEAYFSVGLYVSFLYIAFLLTALISSYAEMQITNHFLIKTRNEVQKS